MATQRLPQIPTDLVALRAMPMSQVCDLLCDLSVNDAVNFTQILAQLGITPLPVPNYGYRSQVNDSATFVVDFNGMAILTDSGAAVFSGGFSGTIRIKRIKIDNPGAKTAAGLMRLSLYDVGNGDQAGTTTPFSLSKGYRNDGTWPLNAGVFQNDHNIGTLNQRLWSTQIWVPAAVASSAPLIFDLTNNGTLEGGRLVSDSANTISQGFALVPEGTTAGLTGLSGSIEFTLNE